MAWKPPQTDEVISNWSPPVSDEIVSNSKPGIIERMKGYADAYKKSPLYKASPVGVLNTANELMRKGYDMMGEKTTEFLGSKQVNPYVSAGLGTAIQMAPDVTMALATPPKPKAGVPEMALTPARRALGFQKPFLKTPFARGQANKAAQTALEHNVIPLSGNPTVMMSRAEAAKSNIGREIGETLKNTPVEVNTVLNDLSSLKTRLSQGADEGILAKANPLIDDVVSSIEDLATKPGSKMTAKTLTEIKTKVSGMVNYFSDLATQTDNKAIANQLGGTIRNLVKTFNSPEVYSRFANNQKLYNAYATMVKGLNNEIAAQMSNMPVSLPSTVMGAGKLATGDIPGAIATTGLFEGVKRRGAGMSARALVDLYRASKLAPKFSPIASGIFEKRNKNEK